MNLLFRFLWVVLAAMRRPSLRLLAESAVSFRVWPNDLDLNGHMNNGRYLTLMDLGRIDLIVRMGLARIALRRRWRPIVGSAAIRFRRSLKPFETYRLHTRLLCWDSKWFFLEHRFERNGQVAAIGFVKGLLRGPGGNVRPEEMAAALGESAASPPMPEAVALWQRSENLGAAAANLATEEPAPLAVESAARP